MNNVVTANELKVRGVSSLKSILSKGLEAVISVRGKNTYVVLSHSEYERLRECELAFAIHQSEQDLKEGRYHEGSIEDHLSRITNA